MTSSTTRGKSQIRAITLSTGLIVVGFMPDNLDGGEPNDTVLLEPLFVSLNQQTGMVSFAEITPLSIEPLTVLRIKAEQALGHAYRIESSLEDVFVQALDSRAAGSAAQDQPDTGMFVKG